MNKKFISLLVLLILLVSVTISYAFFSHPMTSDNNQTDMGGDINPDSLTAEIDSTFLDEDQGIEIGEMV
jgi:hypothetical protein